MSRAVGARILAIFAVVLLAFVYDIRSSGHPDHIITLTVVQGLIDNNNFLTSWHKFDLPEHFKYGQTNFAGYHTVLAGILMAFGVDAVTEKSLHLFSELFVVAFAALLAVLLIHRKAALTLVIFLPFVFMMNFQVFQDAQYYRPESFTGLVFAVFCWGLYSHHPLASMLVAITFAILVATKISFLMFGPVLLVYAWAHRDNVATIAAAALLCICTVFLLNQSILFEFEYFRNGIVALIDQYGGGHPPHGLPDGSLFERLLYSLHYQLVSNGLFIFFAAFGFLHKDPVVKALSGNLLIAIFYFSTKGVYFERNLSFLNWGAALMLAMTALPPRWVNPWLIASCSVSLINIFNFHEVSGLKHSQQVPLYDKPVKYVNWAFDSESIATAVSNEPDYYIGLPTAGHPLFWSALNNTASVAIVDYIPSRFWYFPPSTVHTYHNPGIVILTTRLMFNAGVLSW